MKKFEPRATIGLPEMDEESPEDITLLIRASIAGDDQAQKKLLEQLYGDLRRLAAQVMRAERAGHTLQPTALVNELALKMMGEEKGLPAENRQHFLCLAARAMRRLLVDHARSKRAAKRGSGVENFPIQADFDGASIDGEKLLLVNVGLDRLRQRSERQAEVAEMRIFGGFTVPEIAQALRVTTRTVDRDWQLAKAWLHLQILGNASSTTVHDDH